MEHATTPGSEASDAGVNKNQTLVLRKDDLEKVQEEPTTHMPSKDHLFDDEEDPADHFGSRFVMKEKNPLRIVWSVILCLLLAYTASAFLFRFAFLEFHIGPGDEPQSVAVVALMSDNVAWNALDYTVDALFWVDLVIIFFFTYTDEKGREVDNIKYVAKNYLSFYFWLNLLACLPPEALQAIITLISGAVDGSDSSGDVDLRPTRVYRLQRISRMTRLARVARLVRLVKFAQIVKDNHAWRRVQQVRGVRVINFFGFLMWSVHLLACGWYLCAALHDDVSQSWVARRVVRTEPSGESVTLVEVSAFEQWLVSMYFVLTVFTTVGFGDISAVTEAEIIYVAFTMLAGAVMHSIIISEVIGIVTSTDEVQKIINNQTALIDAYSKHTGLSLETTKELKAEVTWRAKNWDGINKGEMKNLITGRHLPRRLIAKIPASLWGGALLKNDLLIIGANVPPRLPALLAVHLVECEFASGETVYQMGDFPFLLFLVRSGTFAHVGLCGKDGGSDGVDNDDAAGQTQTEQKPSEHSKPSDQPLWALATGAGADDKDGISASTAAIARPARRLYPYRLFSQNSYFGDTEMIWEKPRFSTTRCEREGVTLTLHKTDFQEIQEMFPQFNAAWVMSARRRERYRAQCLGKLQQPHNYKRLAGWRIFRFLQELRERRMAGLPPESKRGGKFDPTRRGPSIYIKGLQPPLSETRQTQVAVDSLRMEIASLREEIRQALAPRPPGDPDPADDANRSGKSFLKI